MPAGAMQVIDVDTEIGHRAAPALGDRQLEDDGAVGRYRQPGVLAQFLFQLPDRS
jgi:hypothetical protein